jgi:PAS domain S-box-containing protein
MANIEAPPRTDHLTRTLTLVSAALCVMVGATVIAGWHLGSEVLVAVRSGSTPVGLPGEAQRSLMRAIFLMLVLGVGTAAGIAAVIGRAQRTFRRLCELETLNYALDHEVQERRQAHASTGRFNRALRMVSACHLALVHATDESDLLHRVCELAAGPGGYRLAWIGCAEDDARQSVRVVAKAGVSSDYITDEMVTWADEDRDRSPTGTAIRTGRPARCDNVLTDPAFLPWRERALRFGLRSLLVVPLLHDAHAFGALSIYASEYDAFQAAEVELFTQLVGDLASSISALRNRAAREAAEHRVRFLASIVDSSDDAIYAQTLDGVILSWNQGALRLYGYSADEMVGKNVTVMVPSGDKDDASEWLARLRSGENVERFETAHRRKDGSPVDVSLTLSAIRDPAGGMVAASSIARDISSRKVTATHLAQMECRYRGLLEAAPDAMVVVNQGGEIVLLNVQAEKQFGYSRDELVGQKVKNIIPEGFAERLIADGTRSAAEALAQQIGTGIELVGRRKDGSEFPIEIMLSPLENAEGILVTAAIRDISVRKAAATHLAQMEGRYRGLLEAAPDAMVVVNQGGEIILLNVQAEKQFGYSRDELVGQKVKNIIPEGFAERLIADGTRSAAEALAQQIGTGIELIGRRKDGSEFPIEIMLSPLENAEGILVTAAIRDISERRAAEQEIFRLNRALKALSKCSEALLHARDQQQLLDEICEIVVRNGGYRMAWVAAAPEPPDNWSRPLARYGATSDYLEVPCLRYNASANSPLLVPTALGTGQPAVCRDTATDPRSASLHEECHDCGSASIIALPLHVEGKVFGALAIYAAETDAFDAPEVELLRELAGNVSFGLESLQARRQKEVAQNELRASEERLRNLIETANEGICTIDADDRTTFVNAKMAAMLGRTSDEILGQSAFDFVDPGQYDELRAAIRGGRDMASGSSEIILLSANGTLIVTSMNYSPFTGPDGQYAGGLAMISDITDRKRAEERLRESEKRYRLLFERTLTGVFRARADGSVLEGNEAFVRMLGYDSIDELLALKLPTMCAAAGFVDHWCDELAEAGHLVNHEIRVLRKDGNTAHLLANLVSLRDPAGNPEFIEGTVLDITQRRQLEAQLLQSQKMEAVGQLAGGIAHDFNNLLMIIRSFAELAGEAVKDDSIRRQLNAILKAADRGAALTRQLLTFGRKQVFSPRLLDINSVIENITKVLPRALGEDVRVEVHASPGLWQVKADPVQIEQVVLNLAVNARDAMPGGGRLTLETSNTVLDTDYVKVHAGVVPGQYVMLVVTDTGQGIPPEALPRIFEPFFTTKERGKGTGLGLSTVYGIVQQSGGFVWVYSEPGKGTAFKVYLPRAGAAVIAGAPLPRNEVPLRGTESILLVEDEEAVRSATRTYLALRGYTVLEAGCGEEALRVSDSHPEKIDLLITDVVMPGMNGNDLGREISARRPGIHVIYVSGYTAATIGEHGVLPASAFLQKPFSLAVLARRVRETLDFAVRLEQERVA